MRISRKARYERFFVPSRVAILKIAGISLISLNAYKIASKGLKLSHPTYTLVKRSSGVKKNLIDNILRIYRK